MIKAWTLNFAIRNWSSSLHQNAFCLWFFSSFFDGPKIPKWSSCKQSRFAMFPMFPSICSKFPPTSIVTTVSTIWTQVTSLACLPPDSDGFLEFLAYSQVTNNSSSNRIILRPQKLVKKPSKTCSSRSSVMQLGLIMLNSSVQVVLRPHIRLPRPTVTHFQLQTPPPDPPAEEGTMSTWGNQGVPFVANSEGVGEVT